MILPGEPRKTFLSRNVDEPAVEVVGPAVVRAAERSLALTAAVDHPCTPVPADVREGVQRARLAPHDEDRHARVVVGQIVAGGGEPPGEPDQERVLTDEESALPCEVHPVNMGRGEHFAPGFVAICRNSKIPAIVDRDGGVSLFESGAILIYLAEKTGRLLPSRNPARAKVMEWLMWQMANIGPD